MLCDKWKFKKSVNMEFIFVLKIENIRRKHNYLPLIMELLKILAKEGQLQPLLEKVNSCP